MILTLDRNFGILQREFRVELEPGYWVLIGQNNIGKSTILQFVFRELMRTHPNYGPNKTAFIPTDRIYVETSAQPGSETLKKLNDNITARLTGENILDYHSYPGHGMNQLSRLILNHSNFLHQCTRLNELVMQLGFPELVIADQQKMTFESVAMQFQGGGLRAIFPILASLTDPLLSAIIIDEPELALEPKLQKKLRDLLLEHSSDKIIIVSTHSHLFLNRRNFSNNKTVQGSNRNIRLEDVESEEDMFNLSFELLGNSIEDLFFPANFIVVEGSSDQRIVQSTLNLLYPDESYKIKVFSAGDIQSVEDKINAILNSIHPLVTADSPYQSRFVVMTDQSNDNTAAAIDQIRTQIGDRLTELPESSLEEYLHSDLYKKANLNKGDVISQIEETRDDYHQLSEIKEHVSNRIASVLNSDDLDKIPEIRDLVQKAINNISD